MMNRSILSWVGALTAACLVVSGCVQEETPVMDGDKVVFTAGQGSLQTRVHYGDSFNNGAQEFFDWDDEDEITIVMLENHELKGEKDYTVSRLNVGSYANGSINRSKAEIVAQGSDFLWGAENVDYDFYAIYPKAGTTGNSLSVSTTDNNKGHYRMTAQIPPVWKASEENNNTYLRKHMVMFARTNISSRQPEVTLLFEPAFTAYHITLNNPFQESMVITRVSLINDKPNNGMFHVEKPLGPAGHGQDYPSDKPIDPLYEEFSEGLWFLFPGDGTTVEDPAHYNEYASESDPYKGYRNNEIVADFGGGLTIEAGGSYSFTLLALPRQSDVVSLSVTALREGQPSTLSKELKHNNQYSDPQAYSFAGLKKHYISLNLPDFSVNDGYTYVFSAVSPSDFSRQAGYSTTGSVTSYKYKGTTDKTPVAWSLDGFFADEACAVPIQEPAWYKYQTWVSGANAPVQGGLESSAYAALNPVQPLKIYHTEVYKNDTQFTKETVLQENVAASINASIAGRPPVGSLYAPVNLANPRNLGSDPSTYIAESANSYIVNGPGWYKIPLVRGNGVKDNQFVSSEKYAGISSEENPHTLVPFYDHLGNPITTPDLPDLGGAAVIWQDNSVSIRKDGEVQFYAPESSSIDGQKIEWLEFYVDATGQGNLVIAVADAAYTSQSLTVFMWSYHIWVTNYASGEGDRYVSSAQAMPYPLGWVTTAATAGTTKYTMKPVYAKLRQAGSGKTAVIRLQCKDEYDPLSAPEGFCPYYQWGRKDPLVPFYGDNVDLGVESRLVLTDDAIKYNTETLAGSVNVDILRNVYPFSIEYPWLFMHNGKNLEATQTSPAWWGRTDAPYNIWNASATASTYGPSVTSVSKTIFDPCPAGYSVPGSGSYTGGDLSFVTNVGIRKRSTNGSGGQAGNHVGSNDNTAQDPLWTAIPGDAAVEATRGMAYTNSLVQQSGSYSKEQGHARMILPMQNTH